MRFDIGYASMDWGEFAFDWAGITKGGKIYNKSSPLYIYISIHYL